MANVDCEQLINSIATRGVDMLLRLKPQHIRTTHNDPTVGGIDLTPPLPPRTSDTRYVAYTPKYLIEADLRHSRFALLLGTDYAEIEGRIEALYRVDYSGELKNGQKPETFLPRAFSNAYLSSGNMGGVIQVKNSTDDGTTLYISGRGPAADQVKQLLKRPGVSQDNVAYACLLSMEYTIQNLHHND